MKFTKKILTIVAILIVASMTIALPVKANTYVDVDTTGDVQVIINTDGSVTLICNGVNIQEEIYALKMVLASIGYRMSSLAQKDVVEELNRTVSSLIGELEGILNDLYGRTNYLASVIGVNQNSSVVTANLKAGTRTVSDYLNSILKTLDSVAQDIDNLDSRISGLSSEIQELESSVDGKFNETYVEIGKAIDGLDAELSRDILTLQKKIDNVSEELDEKREDLRQAVLLDLEEIFDIIDEEKTERLASDDEVKEDVYDIASEIRDMQKSIDHLELYCYLLAIGIVISGLLIIYTTKNRTPLRSL